MSILTALVLAYAFERAHMIIAAPNYGTAYNGFGAIELTYQKQNRAPMAYRVLMPILVVWTEKLLRLPVSRRIDIYQTYKIILTALAFWMVAYTWNTATAAITAVLMLLTIRFDYWSYAPELAGVAAAASGEPALAIPAAVLFALSRESAPITGVIFYLATGDLLGAIKLEVITFAVLALVRMRVGKRPSYTSLVKIKENIARYMQRDKYTGKLIFFLYQPLYYSDPFIAAALTLAATAAAAASGPAGIAVMGMLGVFWTATLTDETRVFIPVIPWIAALLAGGLA